jgi:S1-C subfamily serine protease
MPGWLGALCGIVLGSMIPSPWAPRSTSGRDTATLTPASGRSDARDVNRASTQRLPDVEPTRTRGARHQRASLSASKVAQRALQVSVFVRVGGTYGAGIVLDRGHVLTCGHVLDDTDGSAPIIVETADGTSFQATLLERDREFDLALLSIADATRPRPTFATLASVAIGDEVFAMGAPKRMAFSLHRGMVSFVGREFDGIRYLQTDLPTNGGNSGGPVLNDRGEVVAIASFVLRGSQGIAFALPIDYALQRFGTRLAAASAPKLGQ